MRLLLFSGVVVVVVVFVLFLLWCKYLVNKCCSTVSVVFVWSCGGGGGDGCHGGGGKVGKVICVSNLTQVEVGVDLVNCGEFYSIVFYTIFTRELSFQLHFIQVSCY